MENNKVTNYFKSLSKGGKSAFVIITIFGIMALITCMILLIGVIGTYINISYAKNLDPIGSTYTPTCDSENYWTFKLNEGDEDFKVVQLSDIHLGGGCFSLAKDRKAIDSVYSLIKYNKPDMIAITGDSIYPFIYSSGTKNNARSIKMYLALMDAMEIPYCTVFGNHETEVLCHKSRAEISEMLENGKYSLYKPQSGNGEDVYGEGNYVVKVLRQDNSIHSAYIFMDSNSYTDLKKIVGSDYDRIHDDQVEWYKTEVDKLNGAKSFLFIHIPLQEYQEGWDAVVAGQENAKYYLGYKAEGIYPGKENSYIFDAILEKGSTLGVFCGHDHVNNFSIEYKGVRLTYALSIDFLAYFGIENSNFQRGANILTSYGDENFDISQCVLAGIVGYKKKYKLD